MKRSILYLPSDDSSFPTPNVGLTLKDLPRQVRDLLFQMLDSAPDRRIILDRWLNLVTNAIVARLAEKASGQLSANLPRDDVLVCQASFLEADDAAVFCRGLLAWAAQGPAREAGALPSTIRRIEPKILRSRSE